MDSHTLYLSNPRIDELSLKMYLFAVKTIFIRDYMKAEYQLQLMNMGTRSKKDDSLREDRLHNSCGLRQLTHRFQRDSRGIGCHICDAVQRQICQRRRLPMVKQREGPRCPRLPRRKAKRTSVRVAPCTRGRMGHQGPSQRRNVCCGFPPFARTAETASLRRSRPTSRR